MAKARVDDDSDIGGEELVEKGSDAVFGDERFHGGFDAPEVFQVIVVLDHFHLGVSGIAIAVCLDGFLEGIDELERLALILADA